MAGPNQGASESASARWSARPGAARAVRASVMLVPIAASLLATWSIRPLLPAPDGLVETCLFLLALVATGIGAAMITERAVRRLLPLASLLELSLIFPDQAPSRYRTALRLGTTKQLVKQVDQMQSFQFSPDTEEGPQQILAMVAALKDHEPLTRGHSERVRAYSALIAQELGLSDDQRMRLQWAVLVHDIGKLSVPAELLNKPGRPTDAEWQTIRRHPEVGAAMVEPLRGWLGDYVHAAGQHHERWDGTGYPKGLSGDEISLAGRIVAVADAYDVITSTRSYKSPMSHEAARQELVDCAGTHFDPAIVRAMLGASVGPVGNRSGRFAWLTHLEALFQPGAIASGAGTVAVGTVVAVTGFSAVVGDDTSQDATPAELSFSEESVPETESSVPGPSSTDGVGNTAITSGPVGQAEGVDSAMTQEPPTASFASSSSSSSSSTAGPTNNTPTTNAITPSTTSAPAVGPTSAPTTTLTTTLPGMPPASTSSSVPAGACQQLQTGETELANANLNGCNIAGLSLSGVDLSGANLAGANLTGATVSAFNLDGANLADAILSGSSLSDGSIRGATLTNVSAQGMAMTRVDLAWTDLSGSDLSNTVLTDASFGYVTLVGTQLGQATMSGVNFNDADGTDAVFAGASAIGTEFWRTIMTGASLEATDINSAVFGETNLLGAIGTPLNPAAATYQSATCPNGSRLSTPCWS